MRDAARALSLLGACRWCGGFNCVSETLFFSQIDDPLDAFPIHGCCGAWACLATGIFLRPSYAVSGTDLAYDAMLCYAVSGTDLAYAAVSPRALLCAVRLRLCSAMSGTGIADGELGYGATRSAVLS
eukprot:2212466-Rhodomonas_salina.1